MGRLTRRSYLGLLTAGSIGTRLVATGEGIERMLSSTLARQPATPAAGVPAAGTPAAITTALGGSDWRPERPVTLVCPWAAGGGTDRTARIVGFQLEERFGQPVNVLNRTGGSGAVGHSAGATADPDGHTITIVTVEIAMMHWQGLTEITPEAFAPAAQFNFDPAGVQVRADAPWNSLQELLDAAQESPGELNASGTGQGGIWHLALAGLLQTAGLPSDAISWVPSEGAAPALQELAAGGVDVVTASLAEGASLIDAGEVKPLAAMGEERSQRFPEVPTVREAGFDWTSGAWRGIALPQGTEAPIVAAYEQALADIVQSGEFLEFMETNGFGVVWRNADAFRTFMAEQDQLLGRLMQDIGIVG